MAIDTIGTNAIANDAVNAAKIAAGAVDADITAIPDGSVSTAKLADNAVTGAKLYAENLGRRNLVINGAMQIAQRGTSHTQSPNAGNYHTVDRFSYRRQGTWSGVTAVALSQQTTGGPTGLPYFLRYAPTGSDSTTPADTSMYVDYKFEDKDTVSLSFGNSDAQPFTLSFYVRSTVTGTFSVTFSDAASSAPFTRYVTTYTINAANTWERKIINVPAITSGTWSTTGRSLSIYFMVSGDSDGSSATSTLNQWSTHGSADIRFATTQTEGMTNQTGQTWDITGIQLESGDTATPFEHHGYGEELSLCQRYFQIGGHCTGRSYSGTQAELYYHFLTEMRTSPSISMRGAGNANNYDTGQVHISGVGTYDLTAVAASQPNPTGTVFRPTTSGNWGAGNIVGLRGNIANIDAEL